MEKLTLFLFSLIISLNIHSQQNKKTFKGSIKNHPELAAVIKDYKKKADKEKLQAAYFLIANIGNKGTYTNDLVDNKETSVGYNISNFKSEVPLNGTPAQTIRDSKFNYSIYISTDYENKTQLFIAGNMLHEMVHAYFLTLFDDYYNGNPPNPNAYNDFPYLFNYYVKLKKPASISSIDVHHQQMATSYSDAIARALQEYQTGTPVPEGTNPAQPYTDLAWGGLIGTPVFDNLFPVGSSDRKRIENRYAAEQTGRPVGEGTPQAQTQIGQPCN